MKKILALAMVSFAVALPAAAQDKSCSKADAAKAEKVVDNVTSFAQLHKAWQDWRHCDTGTVSEVYTDAVFRLLVDWKGLDGLASSLNASADYKTWLLARVKSGSKEDRAAIFSRAKTSCPRGQDGLCSDLIAAASDETQKTAAPAADTSTLAPLPALAPAPAAPSKK